MGWGKKVKWGRGEKRPEIFRVGKKNGPESWNGLA